MGECNLDKIERADFQASDSPEMMMETNLRRKVRKGKNEILWRCEIPCTGENGNAFASDSLEAM